MKNLIGLAVVTVLLSCQWLPAQALPEAPVAPPVSMPADVSAATNAPAPTAALLADEGEALMKSGKPGAARDKWLGALAAKPDEDLRAKVESKLAAVNLELIRKPWPMPEKVDYLVQPGDSVKSIANKFGTTVELIVQANELKRPDIIYPGKRLRVFGGKMAIVVNKSKNELLLTSNGVFFKRYRVGTGKYDRTPAGTFVVSDRIKEPVWWRDDGKTVPYGDKENILGTRWLALKATGETPASTGYGIHGTWDNDSIGKSESAGCVRMKNEDVEEIFDIIPVGTPVTIQE